ncbi:MAG: hypothetical protein QOK43_1736 [Acidimicrobiaceae bacterium]|nr:hypothetical protein [Acidimicrobiaceae bacterium]
MSGLRTARLGGAVSLLVAAGAMVAPARATAPTHPTAARLAAPAFAVQPDLVATRMADGTFTLSHPGLSPAAAVRQADWRQGVAASVDAARAVIEQRTGLRLPDLHPATRAQSSAQSSSSTDGPPSGAPNDPPTTGVLTLVSPAGDLNGDGRADVLLYEHDYATDLVGTRAVDGTDGHTLWRRTPAHVLDAITYPTSDLDGDGLADLVVMSANDYHFQWEQSGCDDNGCNHTKSTETYRWDYGVVSGSTGADDWRSSLEGSFVQTYTATQSGDVLHSAEVQEHSFDSVNGFTILVPGGDFDGDGGSDLVWNTVDMHQRFSDKDSRDNVLFSERNETGTTRWMTKSAVVAGRSGRTLAARTTPEGVTLAILMPAGQVVGDATPDLLWDGSDSQDFHSRCTAINAAVIGLNEKCENSGAGPDTQRVAVLDGATMTEAWTLDYQPHGHAYAFMTPDVSGDGVPDVGRLAYLGVGRESTTITSGRDGRELWSASGYPVHTGDDLTGDGRPDVLLAQLVVDSDTKAASFSLGRHDGSTGEEVSSSRVDLGTTVPRRDFSRLYLYDVADAGGTPAPDVLLGSVEATVNGSDVQEASRIVVEDGQAGRIMDVSESGGRVISPLPDVDGDGLTDGVGQHVVIQPGGPFAGDWQWSTSTDGLRRLVDDTSLWTVDSNDTVNAAGDEDGRRGQEVLTTRVTETDRTISTVVTSRDGATGASRWAIST